MLTGMILHAGQEAGLKVDVPAPKRTFQSSWEKSFSTRCQRTPAPVVSVMQCNNSGTTSVVR